MFSTGSRTNFGSNSNSGSSPTFSSSSNSASPPFQSSSNSASPPFSSSSSSSRPSRNQGGNIANLFRSRGRKRRSLRSSTFFQNPLLATVSEFCAWSNPLERVIGLKSLQDSITPC